VNTGLYNVVVVQPASNPGNLWVITLLVPAPLGPPAAANTGQIQVNAAHTTVTAIAVSITSSAGAVDNSFTLSFELASDTTIATQLPVQIKL